MTSKLDLGAWIAGASLIAIVAAIVVGLAVVRNPSDARALRLDEARLEAMHNVAAAAQCAYTYTGGIPASFEEVLTALVEGRGEVAACDGVRLNERAASGIDFRADGGEHIELCAEFLRSAPAAPLRNRYDEFDFPELEAARAAPGRQCFRVRMVSQAGAR